MLKLDAGRKLTVASPSYGAAGFGDGAATLSLIDFRILPRSLLVEMTAVVSVLNAARATSNVRWNR